MRVAAKDSSALAMLSRKLGPDGVKQWLMACAKARELWEGPQGWQSPMRPQLLAMGLGDVLDLDLALRRGDRAARRAAGAGRLALRDAHRMRLHRRVLPREARQGA